MATFLPKPQVLPCPVPSGMKRPRSKRPSWDISTTLARGSLRSPLAVEHEATLAGRPEPAGQLSG